jgi:hypothetical protein
MRRAALSLLVAVVVFVVASCSHKVTGPTPRVEDQALTYCGADQQSFVIKGGGLSPMAREGATDKAKLEMPHVCLTRLDPSGTPTGEKTCVPDQDVEWISQTEIRFTLRAKLGLSPGDYEVVITIPDGKGA